MTIEQQRSSMIIAGGRVINASEIAATGKATLVPGPNEHLDGFAERLYLRHMEVWVWANVIGEHNVRTWEELDPPTKQDWRRAARQHHRARKEWTPWQM